MDRCRRVYEGSNQNAGARYFFEQEIPTAQKVLDACRKNIPDLWQKVVTHVVDKVETACWKADALQEKMAEQRIIPLGEADTSSDSESSVVDSDDDY